MKRLAALLILCASASATNAFAQNWPDTSKIQKWFDDRSGKQYNIEKSGDVQQAGKFQGAGDIAIPKGWAAVKVVKANCKHRVSVCADTLFEFDKSTLTPDAEATLKLVGPKIAELGPHPIKIEGHTDSKGEDAYNQSLSERRAERVKNWLMSNHYIPVSSTIEGFGEKHPVAANTKPDGTDNPQGRQLNRRVEIVVDTCTTLEAPATIGNTTLPAQPPEPTAAKSSFIIAAAEDDLLPYQNVLTPEEIKAGYANVRVKPLDDPNLYFEVLLPNDWESRPVTVTKKQIAADHTTQVPLAELVPSKESKVLTEVRYSRVGDEMTPERYLLSYATQGGFEIVKRQHAEFNGRKAEDALLKLNSPEFGPMLTRLTVSKRGEYMFMVASSSPAHDYDRWKKVFAAAAMTFDPSGTPAK
jgi:outer membrane protein OmpA-like peptidoglycan-associated protein